jgi:hypothetical protein
MNKKICCDRSQILQKGKKKLMLSLFMLLRLIGGAE